MVYRPWQPQHSRGWQGRTQTQHQTGLHSEIQSQQTQTSQNKKIGAKVVARHSRAGKEALVFYASTGRETTHSVSMATTAVTPWNGWSWGQYLSFSSFLSGVWSVVSFMGFPFLHKRARLSPTLATTSSIPSLNKATVAVVPEVRRLAANIGKYSIS